MSAEAVEAAAAVVRLRPFGPRHVHLYAPTAALVGLLTGRQA